jgi:PAS domain S-box-containing protein
MIGMNGQPIRVLLVDDDAEDAMLTQRLLQGAAIGQYEVDWRDGFDSGLIAMGTTDYDVMLLDFTLSGENGLDLLRAARDRGTRSPAILLTGQVDRDLDVKAMQAGVVDFLEKNHLNGSILERSVRYAAGRGRADRERVRLLEAERTARDEAEVAQEHTASILERLEAERTLLHEVLEQLPVGVVIAEYASGQLTHANAEIDRMLGYRVGSLTGVVGLHEWSGFHDDGTRYEVADWPLARTLHSGESIANEEVTMTRNDGTTARIRLHSALVRGSDGNGRTAVMTLEDITASSATIEAMRVNEAFFRAAFLQSALPSVLVSREGFVIQANEAMCALLGYSLQRLTGMSVLAFTHPLDRQATNDVVFGLPDAGTDSAQVEKRYVHADGHVIDVQANAALVRLADGTPAYFTTQVFDISEHKRAQREVKEREEHLAAIVTVQQEVATMALDDAKMIDLVAERTRTLTNADGACVAMLRGDHLVFRAGAGSGLRLAGTSWEVEGSLTGQCIEEARPLRCDDLMTELSANQPLAAAAGARCLICVPLLDEETPIGVLVVWQTTPNSCKDRDVHTLQLMAGLAAAGLAHTTAFAAKQALVAEHTRALATLGERESQIRSLIENAADPLITLDEKGLISYASPTLGRLLGRSNTDFIGVHPTDLSHPEDRAIIVEAISQMIATSTRNLAVEARLEHRDGSWRTFRVTGRNKLDDPAVRGIIVNLHDMTDEVLTASQLRQSQKLEAVGQLAGGVAHDFNNLLTVISGHTEFLADTFDNLDPRKDDVEEIRLAARRAAGLTRQLLTFSRQQILQPRVLNLNAVVMGLQPMLRRLIGEDIGFVVRPCDDLSTVLADQGQLEQVLMNLVINGRDAMPSGGTLTIEIQQVELDGAYPMDHSGVIPGTYVMLAVTDTGMGMSKEVREQIFDPFFTTKEAGKGTGLGLSTVYGIVKQSNGYIWAYSEPGLWSTFKVYIPLSQQAPSQRNSGEVRVIARGSETVLLVEDEEAVRTISRRMLLGLGYNVLEARDGMHALEVAAACAETIHLLVTDVVMPRMNGRALADQLHLRRPNLKVLYVSGYTNDEILRRSPAEADARLRLLQKPFTTQGLGTAVRDALSAPTEVFA